MRQQPALTADEQKLNDVWNEHLRASAGPHAADERAHPSRFEQEWQTLDEGSGP